MAVVRTSKNKRHKKTTSTYHYPNKMGKRIANKAVRQKENKKRMMDGRPIC